jgi:hypothetical protein
LALPNQATAKPGEFTHPRISSTNGRALQRMSVDREGSLRLPHRLAGALLLLHLPAAAFAGTVWDMTTEYPQGAMPGLGMTTFAQHVARLTAGKLVIQPSFDAAKGVRSADMLAALAEGRVAAGDAFAGALEAEDAIFALPSLPFLVTSIADARRLADLARPYLAAALQNRGARLLYLTPWPPTGIWSKAPLKTPSDLSGLSIRTYDRISREVFAGAGARALSISFADTLPRLADGSINAVLSSGDGEAGRKLWGYLPYLFVAALGGERQSSSLRRSRAGPARRGRHRRPANRDRVVARFVQPAATERPAHARGRRDNRCQSCARHRRSAAIRNRGRAAGLVREIGADLPESSRRLQNRQAIDGYRRAEFIKSKIVKNKEARKRSTHCRCFWHTINGSLDLARAIGCRRRVT